MSTMMIRGLAALLIFACPLVARAATLEVDPAHTGVGFKVRHLFTNVNGRFDRFEGTIAFDPDAPEKTTIEGTIDAASIDTDNEKRDAHLRAADFFDVEKHPKITFESTKVTDVDRAKKTARVHGVLGIRGVEKPVVLEASFLGQGKDPWGNERYGFHAETTIDRKDFGLTWNETLETGGLLVGEDVTIVIDAEATPR
jgi:polyisoprenoid-binding protein YceI